MEIIMTRKETTPKEVTEILALREAGYTVLAISQKFNISVRTVNRHLANNSIKKGSLKLEVIEQARSELFKLVTSSPAIRAEAAKLISDDLAHSNHLRTIMLEASEFLNATTTQEAMHVMRAAAAYSTALKNTSDTIRHSLGSNKVDESPDEFPELVVRELTNVEIKEMMSEREEED